MNQLRRIQSDFSLKKTLFRFKCIYQRLIRFYWIKLTEETYLNIKRNCHPVEKGARAVTQIVTNIIIMSFVHNKRQLNNTYGGKLVIKDTS